MAPEALLASMKPQVFGRVDCSPWDSAELLLLLFASVYCRIRGLLDNRRAAAMLVAFGRLMSLLQKPAMPPALITVHGSSGFAISGCINSELRKLFGIPVANDTKHK